MEQISALRSSCQAYDSGTMWEAKRIATTIYVLVHDGKRNSRSLMSQLQVRDIRLYFSTQHPDPALLPGHAPLIAVQISGESARCVALRDEALNVSWVRWLPFEEWWTETIYMSQAGMRLTREDIVRTFRDQDGGGHFDPVLRNEAYAELRDYNFERAMSAFDPSILKALSDVQRVAMKKGTPFAHSAAIRQIGWEFLYSIDNCRLHDPASN